jgi:ureidoglycolate amidohydrolase
MNTHPRLEIDGLIAELMTLAQISEAEPPIVTRVVFSEADRRARAYLKGLCAAAGLTVREDAVGNTFARWQGSDAELAPVGTGSHIDAIPNAGLYDGCVGVLGGLEAIRVLQHLGFKPRRSIELVIFTAEEPTRFGIGCLGSRMMANVLTPAQALALRDKEGRGLEELRTQAGFAGTLESVALPLGRFHQFIELHIEQGPLLEQEGIDVGLVTHIAAPASVRIVIEGEGGHAGGKADARTQRCARRGCGADSSFGDGSQIYWSYRYRGYGGRLRGLSGSGQQHSFARAP